MKILCTELERIWKDMIIDCFKVISWKFVRVAIFWRILNLVCLNITNENVKEEIAVCFQCLNRPTG
jgi:hypothetical protein